MKSAQRSYLVGLIAVFVAYALLLVVSAALLKRYPTGSLRIPIALAPMIPVGILPFLVVRLLRRIDELQRRIQLEALGFACGATAVITFAYGFLEGVGFPAASWFWVWPLMAALWLIGLAGASRRYR